MKRSGLPSIRRVIALVALITLMASAMAAERPSTDTPEGIEAGDEAVAIFAGGCFWCMEPPFDKLDGVLATTSGYIGGHLPNPTYKDVSGGQSGHIEAVEIRYDPRRVDYATLLEVFWRNIDPVAVNRQFCDAGPQYRSAIFPLDDAQRALAQASLEALAGSGRLAHPIATEIIDATRFYPAEAYHQDYYLKNPLRYRYYRSSCGRDRRLQEIWGKPDA